MQERAARASLVSGANVHYVPQVIHDASLDDLLQKVWDGQRINQAEALRLYHLPLEELGALADRRRQLARADTYDGRGNEIVTYIVDRNINYTNICNVYCKFCAFYRTEKDDDAYVIALDELDKKIEETLALGDADSAARRAPSQAHQAVVSGPAGPHEGQVPAD